MTKYYSKTIRIISIITLIAFVSTQVAFGYEKMGTVPNKPSDGGGDCPHFFHLRSQQPATEGNSVGADLANSIGAPTPQRDITVDIVDPNSQQAENRTIPISPIKTLVLKLISGFFMTIFPSAVAMGNTACTMVSKVFAIRPEGLKKAHKSYGRGLMAYQVIERAEHNGIPFSEIANSFMSGADNLFAQWKEWKIIEDSDVSMLSAEAKEDLLSGVWYLVAKEADYPYKRRGTRFWEGTVVKLNRSKEVIVNGVVHGVYLLRGNYREIRGILEKEGNVLTLFEQNLSELYRVEGTVEMDDHEMMRIVEERIKQDAREMKKQKPPRLATEPDGMPTFLLYIMPFALLFVGGFLLLYCPIQDIRPYISH